MVNEGRHHGRSDAYDAYRSRDHTDRTHKPRDPAGQGSADDRRPKQREHREMTQASHRETPAYRDQDRREPSRLSRETAPHEPQYYEPERRRALYNLKYILTTRGLCQAMEVFVNLLIVICAGVPYSNNGGYRDLASLGGLYHYYYGGAQSFSGADADRVKELDQLFHQIKRPPYIFAMVCGGLLMIYALAMLALGVFRVPYRFPPVLLGEALVNFLIGLGYIPALAFYFIKLQETYNNPICQEREQMYKSKGHKGFECKVHGADIAGGLFGALGVLVFIFGGVLAIKAFRLVREMKRQRNDEADQL